MALLFHKEIVLLIWALFDAYKKWNKGVMLTTEHFYHIGAKEKNRNQMIEALVVSKDNVNMYKS